MQSKSLMKVQGDKLVVAAPPVFQKPPTPVAPKVVKEKIQKPTMEHGWTAVSDPKAQTELKEKMKSELQAIFETDQAERQSYPPVGTPEYWPLRRRDVERRQRVAELMAAIGIKLCRA